MAARPGEEGGKQAGKFSLQRCMHTTCRVGGCTIQVSIFVSKLSAKQAQLHIEYLS